MRITIFLCALLLCNFGFAENRYTTLKTPDSEVQDVIKFVTGRGPDNKYYINEIDRPYVKFLSTYAVKNDKERKDLVLATTFLLHSLVGPAKNFEENTSAGFRPMAKMIELKDVDTGEAKRTFVPLQNVPFSDTLWWLDVRDYNWTSEAWEIAAAIDAYFNVPVVQEQHNGELRLTTRGNSILRMDWFISQFSDTTQQRDNNRNFDLYNTFLFAQVVPPKNIDEWKKYFALDTDKARRIGNEAATLVTHSEQIARHNRELYYYKTDLGYLYQTYDFKNQEGVRDRFEAFHRGKFPGRPPDIFDAGEVFGTNQLGLQVYALHDGEGKLINFGDPTVVRYVADKEGDVRVRIAFSCIDCHAAGPLEAENTLLDFVKKNGLEYSYNHIDANRISRVFLNERFEDSIVDSKSYFAKSLLKTNGLTPEENGRGYMQSVINYLKPLDIEQAAFECGVDIVTFKEKILNPDVRFGGRLKLLVQTGRTIPRNVWETKGQDGIPGQFQQAMTIIHGLTEIKTNYAPTVKTTQVQIVPQKVEEKILTNQWVVLKDCVLSHSSKNIANIPKGSIVQLIEINGNSAGVRFNGQAGWISKANIMRVQHSKKR